MSLYMFILAFSLNFIASICCVIITLAAYKSYKEKDKIGVFYWCIQEIIAVALFTVVRFGL